MLRTILIALALASAANSAFIPVGKRLKFNDTNVRACVAADEANITTCKLDKEEAFNASIEALRNVALPAILNSLTTYAQASGRRALAYQAFNGPAIELALNESLYPIYQEWWCNRAIVLFNSTGSCIKPCLDPAEGTLLGVQIFDRWCEMDFLGHDPAGAPDLHDNGSYANGSYGYASQYISYLTTNNMPVISPLSRFWKINGSFANDTRDDILAYYGCPSSCPQLIQTAMDSANGGAGVLADSGSGAECLHMLSGSVAFAAVLAAAAVVGKFD